MIIWQTSTDNSTWVQMKTPDSYKIDWEDLDNDSYRSVVNGNLIRSVVKKRWAKVGLSFKFLTNTEVNTLLSAVNQDTVYFKFRSPAFGTSDFISFKGYVSKMSTSCDNINRWDVSFNVVQSEGASWQ